VARTTSAVVGDNTDNSVLETAHNILEREVGRRSLVAEAGRRTFAGAVGRGTSEVEVGGYTSVEEDNRSTRGAVDRADVELEAAQ
jgi:hypothetical protein